MDYVKSERKTDIQRKNDLTCFRSPLAFPIRMIHLSIIFSEDYIIQLKRPFFTSMIQKITFEELLELAYLFNQSVTEVQTVFQSSTLKLF